MIDLTVLVKGQKRLNEALGHNYETMTIEERISYIKENVLACIAELNEALNEVGWKSWATSQHINKEQFFGELRDAWQFLTNLMLVIEHNPEDLAKKFAASVIHKHIINMNRINDGYDGVSTKCSHCGRALDEVIAIEIINHDNNNNNAIHYCICGTEIKIT